MTHPHEGMREGSRWLPVTFWLYMIAAVLALAAALLEYLNDRKIATTSLGGGLFMLVMAIVTRVRMARKRDGGV